jgi:hypothetical protein
MSSDLQTEKPLECCQFARGRGVFVGLFYRTLFRRTSEVRGEIFRVTGETQSRETFKRFVFEARLLRFN